MNLVGEASQNISLCEIESAKASDGDIKIRGSTAEKIQFLIGYRKVDIEGVQVLKVESTGLQAKNCHIKNIKAQFAAILTNCSGDSVEVERGVIFVSSEDQQERKMFDSLKALERIALEHMTISDSVNSKHGVVDARDSIILGKCECFAALFLSDSEVSSATVTCPSDLNIVDIALNQGTIKGDLHIGKEILPDQQISEAPAALSKVLVMIRGTGTIQGNITFDGCAGDVCLSSTVQHLGKIV